MKKKVLRIVLVLALVLFLTVFVEAAIALLPRPPHEAAELMIPILDAYLAYSWSESDSDAEKLDTQLDTLSKDQRFVADQASVLLLDYYLGEHNAEVQLCSVTKRGSRVMPILMKYRRHRLGVPKLRYALSRLTKRERDALYQMAMDAIHSGKPYCD